MALDPSTYFGALTVRRKLETMLAEIDALQAAVDALELGGGAVSAPAGELLFGNAGGDGVESDAGLKLIPAASVGTDAFPNILKQSYSVTAAAAQTYPGAVGFKIEASVAADVAEFEPLDIETTIVSTHAGGDFSTGYFTVNFNGNAPDAVARGLNIQAFHNIGGALGELAALRLQAVTGNDATAVNQYGLKIDDVTGGTTNKAIQTGLGLVDLGDDTSIDGDLAVTGNLSAANFSTPLTEPAAPTVAVQGTPGSTVYHYQIVANNALGSTNAGKFSTTTDGAAAMDETDFNRLTWVAVTGATSYDVYRQKGTDIIWKKIATALVAVTLDDTGIVGTTAEPPTVNTTAMIASYALKHAIRYFTDAELKALPTTAGKVVPAAGAEKMLLPFSAHLRLKWTADYTNVGGYLTLAKANGTSPSLQRLDESTLGITLSSLLADGESSSVVLGPAGYANAAPGLLETGVQREDADYVNGALYLVSVGNVSDFTGGDPANVLKATVFYCEVDV